MFTYLASRLRQGFGGHARQTRLVIVLTVLLMASLAAHVFPTESTKVEASDGTVASPGPPKLDQSEGGSPGFLSARIGPAIGRSTLDLRETGIAPGQGAIVTVFVALGQVIVRVPDGWEVDATGLSWISTVKDTRRPRTGSDAASGSAATGPAPRLVLRGAVMMGGIEIAS
jgi:hypothetical protein